MKTKSLLIILAFLPILFSCKKSSDEELKFTSLTVEQQKQKIEDNGINFLNNLQKIEDTQTYSTLQNFIDLANGSSSAPKMVPVLNHLMKIKSLNVYTPLQKTIIPDDRWGKFEWDFTNKEFVQTATYTSEKMVVLFPSTKGGTTNNAEFSFTLTNSSVMSPDNSSYLPSTITSTLKVGGTTLVSQNFTATYANGYPDNVSENLTVEKFVLNATSTHTDKNISSATSFKYDGSNLMSYEIKSDGTYDKSTLDNIEDAPVDIVSNANVKFSVMNIGFVGSIADFKGMADAIQTLENKSNLTQEQYVNESAEIINKYLKMFGYFVDENKKFADIEAYAGTTTYTSQYWYWDEATQSVKYTETTETYPSIKFRFVMGDGSKVDVEDYVQQGFEDLQTKLEDLLSQYNN